MSRTFHIGFNTDRGDPFWILVEEAIYRKAQQLPVNLVRFHTDDHLRPLAEDERIVLVEELLAQQFDVLIGWQWPEDLAYQVLEAGLPIVHLSETDIKHPLSVSPKGLGEVAQLAGDYLAQQLNGRGHVLILGGQIQPYMQDDGRSRIQGIKQATATYPHISLEHIPCSWVYKEACVELQDAMQQLKKPLDAIIGLSDPLALAGRDVGRNLNLVDENTLVIGINGDPQALEAIAEGSMTATVDIFPDELSSQVVELACQAAQRKELPPHFEYKSRLVTPENVSEMAAQKLFVLAHLSDRLLGVSRREQHQRLRQLETNLEISRRVGSILTPEQLAHEVADLICANYDYNQAYILRCITDDELLVLNRPDDRSWYDQIRLPLGQSKVLSEALRHQEAVFIPNIHRSIRFTTDRTCPETLTRIVLPIWVGDTILGLLDLHSHNIGQHTRQELAGLQTLANQLGIALRNAELYSQAVEAQAAAEKADQLKTRLLANVSHELRTPLNVILGYTQGILEDVGESEVKQLEDLSDRLVPVQHNAEHLRRLIDDLLDLSRAEIDELELSLQIIDLRSLLVEVFDSIKSGLNFSESVVWQLDLPNRLPMIQADPVRLRQILANLLSNAHKFTEQGEIALGATISPPHLQIWVRDTGIGIPLDQQEFIFEPFNQANGNNRRREGIGLGLSITRRLAALHGGSMAVESRPGQGSTFRLYLPLPSLLEQPAMLPISADPILLLVSSREQPSSEIVHFSRHKGLNIHRVRTKDEIDDILAEKQPTALAWDLAGADPETWTLIEQVRLYPALRQISFLLYGQVIDPSSSNSLGATNFMIKPILGETLQEAITALGPEVTAGPILIVEDDAQSRTFYENLVRQTFPSYMVQTAENGTIALEMMLQTPPSLVLLDLMMPGVDGFEVLEQMRIRSETRQVPVLVISGRALSANDIQRVEQHTLVTLQTKDVLKQDEIASAIHRSLFGVEILPPHTSALVKRAVSYFHQNYNHTFTRQDLSQAVGASDNYLSQIFRQDLGLSPWEYLNRYRIKKAKELLHNTTDSVTTIALQVGFNDPAYFSRVFRKQSGMSPTAYRAS